MSLRTFLTIFGGTPVSIFAHTPEYTPLQPRPLLSGWNYFLVCASTSSSSFASSSLRFYHISCSGATPCLMPHPALPRQTSPKLRSNFFCCCCCCCPSVDAFYAFSLFRISIFNLAIFFANLLSDFCTVYLAAPCLSFGLSVGFKRGNSTLSGSKQRGGG